MRGIGTALILSGLVLLLFVAYRLWGTGIEEARAQQELAREFEQVAAPVPVSPEGEAAPIPPPPEPVPGGAVALLRIPRIGLDKVVVEGVALGDLKKGPGHYPGTPLPGQVGNAAVAGHRTTYGQPFFRLDELAAGDVVQVTTAQGRFRYEVVGSKVVEPSDLSVLAPTTDALLTLTTCHPRFSARQRLVVTARLTAEPAPSPPPPAEPRPDEPPPADTPPRPVAVEAAALEGDDPALAPTVLWGSLVVLVALAAWALARRWGRWRRWTVYALAIPPLVVTLFVFFEHLSRLLPADI